MLAAVPIVPLYRLGEIVVTGERPRVVDTVTGTEIVTAEEIERAGVRTVDEAIAMLPGVFVRRGAQGVPLIDIRGFRTRNVLLLLDGVPLNSSFDGLFDPASLSVGSIARIKLTRGSSSMLYGPGGNAGVLNIVTRGAGEEPHAQLRFEAGDSSSRDVRTRATWRHDSLGFVVGASMFDQSSFELSRDFETTPLEDGGDRLNSDRRDGSVFASVSVDSAPATRFGLTLNYRGSERGKPPVTEDARSSPFAPRPRFERAEQQALSVHMAASHELGESWTLRPSLYLNRTDEITDSFDDDSFATQDAEGSLHEEALSSTLGGALQVARRQGRSGLLTVAVDRREERWEAEGFRIAARGGGGGGGMGGGGSGGMGESMISIDSLGDERAVDQSSLAIEYEHAPRGPWSTVLGVGWAAQRREENGTDDDVSFLLGGSRALGPSLALRASVARRIRFPTLRDLYAADRGNSELAPEQTLDFELSFERSLGAGDQSLELTLFRIEADDFIERVPNDVLRNIQQSRFQGIELSGRHLLGRRGRLSWSYTYLESVNLSASGGTEKTQNRPEHKVALVAEHAPGRGLLRLRGEVLVVADSYALSRGRPARAMELGDYALVGGVVSYPLAGERLRLVGRVRNLLDTDSRESIGFPAPGREVFLGLELGRIGRRADSP